MLDMKKYQSIQHQRRRLNVIFGNGLRQLGAGSAEFGASLPPAVLADNDARVEMLVEPRSGAHLALGGLDRYPVAGSNAACLGSCGVEFDFRMRGAFAARAMPITAMNPGSSSTRTSPTDTRRSTPR